MKILTKDYENIWFSSDLHLGHDKDFLYIPRGCDNRDMHSNMIIDGINSQASTRDLVILCGDTCLTSTYSEFLDFVDRINCKNILSIIGNHDGNLKKYLKEENCLWTSLNQHAEITISEPSKIINKKNRKYSITLNHYPLEIWNKSHHGSWHLCGHSHGSFYKSSVEYQYSKRFDCGVDNGLKYKSNNTFMFSLDDVKSIMHNKLTYEADLHNKNVN